MNTKDFERATDALTSIKFIREFYASGPEGQRLLQEVLKMLRGNESNIFCANIADAIDAANRMKRIQIVEQQAAA